MATKHDHLSKVASNIIILLIFLYLPSALFGGDKRYEFEKPLMGSQFRLVFYAASDSLAQAAARKVFNHLEYLNVVMSDYLDGSELNRLCALSGNGYWVRTSPVLFSVLDSARNISGQTDGIFDVTIGAVTQVWRKASRQGRFPERTAIRRAVRRTGYRWLEIDRDHHLVRLKKSGMRLDLGGIGKGFAADEGIRILKEMNIGAAMVDAGGDLALSGPPPGEKGWKISVSSGTDASDDEVLLLADCGVATSGATYRYIMHKGKKYSHIMDPRTGIGLTRAIRATVIAPNGTRADAMSKLVSVLSIKKSRKILAHFPDVKVKLQETDLKTGKISNWQNRE